MASDQDVNGLAPFSAPWLAQVLNRVDRALDPTGEELPPGPSIIVGHVVSTPHGVRHHHQVWEDGRLVSWEPGLHPDVELTLLRTHEIDEGALADRLGSDEVAAGTRFGDPRGGEFDLLGTPGRLDRDLDGWRVPAGCAVDLDLIGTPFGAVAVHLAWDGEAIRVGYGPTGESSVRMAMSYEDAVEWLWGDLIIGHLMHRTGIHVLGDIFLLSALEGLVSAPGPGRPVDAVDALRRYADIRALPSWDIVCDIVDLLVDARPEPESARVDVAADERLTASSCSASGRRSA